MNVNNKRQKSSKLVKKVTKNLCNYQFLNEDPNIYDEYDPITNYCVVIPFGEKSLLVEVSAVDRRSRIHFKLRGVIENNEETGLSHGILPDMISVGELTLHEKIIVNYDALLTLEINNSSGKQIIINADFFTFRELEIICSQALEFLLCDRTFVVDKSFHLDGGLGLVARFSLI